MEIPTSTRFMMETYQLRVQSEHRLSVVNTDETCELLWRSTAAAQRFYSITLEHAFTSDLGMIKDVDPVR